MGKKAKLRRAREQRQDLVNKYNAAVNKLGKDSVLARHHQKAIEDNRRYRGQVVGDDQGTDFSKEKPEDWAIEFSHDEVDYEHHGVDCGALFAPCTVLFCPRRNAAQMEPDCRFSLSR